MFSSNDISLTKEDELRRNTLNDNECQFKPN